MFYKIIFLFFFLSFNLGIAGETNLAEIKTNSQTSTTSKQLSDYYSEFKEPVMVKDDYNSDTNTIQKSKTLTNYYSEYL